MDTKGGLSVQQPIAGDELRALRRHLAVRRGELPWLFLSERSQPLTRQAVSYLVGLAAKRAGLSGIHPHTLRYSCGYYLANKGNDLCLIQDYLGHRDPKHTVRYTRTAGRRCGDDAKWPKRTASRSLGPIRDILSTHLEPRPDPPQDL